MKKISFKLLLIAIFGFFISCDDQLEQNPNNSFSPDTYYKTTADFNNAAMGMYSGILGYYVNYLSLPDIMSDNVILTQRGRRSNVFFYEWRYVPNSTWNIMTTPYVVTNRANYIIANIDNLPEGAEKNNFLGEAKAVRAMMLFDMLRVYSQIPTQSAGANASLGMPINTTIDPNFVAVRPTVAESYAFVISELEEAKGLIGDNGTDRMGIDGVNALLSRVYLYNGEYQKAADAAAEVTTPLATAAQFPAVWNDSQTDDVIFKINQDRNLDGISLGTEWSQSSAGTIIPEYSIPLDFFSQFNGAWATAYTGILPDSEGNIYNVILKMFGEQGQQNGVVDAKILRAGEVYLNRAEALARLGQDGPALGFLNDLREARGIIDGTETGVALLDAIKSTRRLELAFEGHRFFDLKRWNEPVVRLAGQGEFFDGSGTPPVFLTLPAGDHRFQLPIPQGQINIFPDLQQNPGYTSGN